MDVKAIHVYAQHGLKDDYYPDLALSRKMEFAQHARPVCLAAEFDDYPHSPVTALFWGNSTSDGEVTRMLYQTDLYVEPYKSCAERMGDKFYGDNFCLQKNSLVFVDGINTGAPILINDVNEKDRYIQVGISLQPDEGNNVGSATRLDLYHHVIKQLTNCYLIGSGIDTVQTSDPSKGCASDATQCVDQCFTQ